MDRQMFMGKLYETLQRFETHWNKMQREHGNDEWPTEMDEAEWWDQFYAWLDVDQG